MSYYYLNQERRLTKMALLDLWPQQELHGKGTGRHIAKCHFHIHDICSNTALNEYNALTIHTLKMETIAALVTHSPVSHITLTFHINTAVFIFLYVSGHNYLYVTLKANALPNAYSYNVSYKNKSIFLFLVYRSATYSSWMNEENVWCLSKAFHNTSIIIPTQGN